MHTHTMSLVLPKRPGSVAVTSSMTVNIKTNLANFTQVAQLSCCERGYETSGGSYVIIISFGFIPSGAYSNLFDFLYRPSTSSSFIRPTVSTEDIGGVTVLTTE